MLRVLGFMSLTRMIRSLVTKAAGMCEVNLWRCLRPKGVIQWRQWSVAETWVQRGLGFKKGAKEEEPWGCTDFCKGMGNTSCIFEGLELKSVMD